MTGRLLFKAQAQQDILDASLWYEQNATETLGKDFLQAVLKECEYIQMHPLAYPKKYKNTRELVMKRFPYIIVYRVEKDAVFVLAVFNAKLDPAKKRERR
jgi:toxin ParE1/3/4